MKTSGHQGNFAKYDSGPIRKTEGQDPNEGGGGAVTDGRGPQAWGRGGLGGVWSNSGPSYGSVLLQPCLPPTSLRGKASLPCSDGSDTHHLFVTSLLFFLLFFCGGEL